MEDLHERPSTLRSCHGLRDEVISIPKVAVEDIQPRSGTADRLSQNGTRQNYTLTNAQTRTKGLLQNTCAGLAAAL